MAYLLPLALLAVFLVFRANPQRRRVMSQQALHSQLAPGDKVVTGGGMIGTLVGIEGDRAAVEIAPDVIVEFLLAGIVRRDDEPAGAPAPPVGQDEGTPGDRPSVVPDDLSGLHPSGDRPPPPDEDPTAPHHEES